MLCVCVEVLDPPEAVVKGSCAAIPHQCWEPNSGSLYEQYVLLTAKLSFQLWHSLSSKPLRIPLYLESCLSPPHLSFFFITISPLHLLYPHSSSAPWTCCSVGDITWWSYTCHSLKKMWWPKPGLVLTYICTDLCKTLLSPGICLLELFSFSTGNQKRRNEPPPQLPTVTFRELGNNGRF